MKKILFILLGIMSANLCVFAIESDFKNSLLKIDYVKTGNDSYCIKLFTQKPYSEPIKVIKKTNTNYYILLPETFHSVGSIAPTGDIKSTEVKLFPYAGQDLNNGYTKINIFTSRPLNISAQLNSATKNLTPTIDAKDLAKLDSAFSAKQSQINETQAQRQAQIRAQEEKRIAAQKAQQEAQRQAQIRAQEEKRIAAQKAQQEAQRQAQIRAQRQKMQQKQIQSSNNLQVLDTAGEKYEGGNSSGKKSNTELNNKTPNEIQDELNKENVVTQEIINNPEINKTSYQIPENQSNLGKKAYIKKVLKNKLKTLIIHLKPYYYIIKDNIILAASLFIAFSGILMLALIGKNKKKGTNATMDTQQTPDKNIEEQSRENITTEPQNDDIQSLKDEFKELAYDDKNIKKTQNIQTEEQYIEPTVLSSAEIAPNRGFMVIERQGTKALFGYIYEDVFLLYQFREFISDYAIKFRISEKQDSKTFFIVKVDKFKLLVKVTNSQMKLELEM